MRSVLWKLVVLLLACACASQKRMAERVPAGNACIESVRAVVDSPRVAWEQTPLALKDLIRKPWVLSKDLDAKIRQDAEKGEIQNVVYYLLENRVKGYRPGPREKILRRIYEVMELDERYGRLSAYYSGYTNRIYLPNLHPWTRAFVIGHEGRHFIGNISPTLRWLDVLSRLFLPARDVLTYPFLNLRESSALGFEWEVLSRIPVARIEEWKAIVRNEAANAASQSTKVTNGGFYPSLERAHLSKREFIEQMMKLRGFSPYRGLQLALKNTVESPFEWAKLVVVLSLLYRFDVFSHDEFSEREKEIRGVNPEEFEGENRQLQRDLRELER